MNLVSIAFVYTHITYVEIQLHTHRLGEGVNYTDLGWIPVQ